MTRDAHVKGTIAVQRLLAERRDDVSSDVSSDDVSVEIGVRKYKWIFLVGLMRGGIVVVWKCVELCRGRKKVASSVRREVDKIGR